MTTLAILVALIVADFVIETACGRLWTTAH